MPMPFRKVAQQGTINQVTTVRVAVELSEHVYDAYAEQAIKRNVEPEQLMAERLRRTKDQQDDGMFFNDAQKRRLCRCVGHTVGDADGALQWLEMIAKIKVNDVTIELEPRLLQKMSTRVPRGGTIERLISSEVVKGLRRFVGLDPW